MQTLEDAFDAVISELKELFVRKQRQYGHGNINAFGELGVMVRVSDKVERIKNLWKTGKTPEDESVVDSWRDLANYAIIWMMLQKGIFNVPLKEDEKRG